MEAELGNRVVRAMAMENTGPKRRRAWWIVSAAVSALVTGIAA
jgi:hypothetical protein